MAAAICKASIAAEATVADPKSGITPAEAPTLAQFSNPPTEAAPGVWWHWVGGIPDSPSDVTADLDAMKGQGIGRVTLFEQTDRKVPANADWMNLFGHASVEAGRLGLAFEIHDSWHYNVSHGPWITPETAQKVLTWSRIFVNGPSQTPLRLSQPPPAVDKPGYKEFYRDIATFAVRVSDPVSVVDSMADAAPVWSLNRAEVQRPTPARPLTRDLSQGEAHLTCEFSKPFAAAGLFMVFGEQNAGSVDVEASEDGVTFHTLAKVELKQRDRFINRHWQHGVWNFETAPARFFRLRFEPPAKGAVPLRLGHVQWFLPGEWPRSLPPVARPALKNGDSHIWEDLFERNRVEASAAYSSVHQALPPGRVAAEVIDLTDKMQKDGTLDWSPPSGAWVVYRLGYCAKKIHFDSCDKLDPSGVELHFANYPAPLIKKAREAGGAVPDVFIDSWEVGGQNWSANFPQQFQKRRGYDLRPYLPVLVGEVVGSADTSNRFLWDFRRTIGDLMAENYFGRLRDLCHAEGVGFTAEAGPALSFRSYHDLMMDLPMQYGRADLPMGEFWSSPNPETDNPARSPYENVCIRSAVSAAHLYGKPVVQAEAFTGGGNFRAAPSSLKSSGDRAFCMGINRLIIHEYTVQSAEDSHKPGRSWVWGTDWQRNITWWDDSHHWLDYLRRCQFLLQKGQPVVDVCVFLGEGVPAFPGTELLELPDPSPPPAYRLPNGFKQDWCSAEALQTMRVDNGEIVLPGGMRYRLLLLPEQARLSPEALRKVQALVAAGATVMGPKPLESPGLSGFPDSDREVRTLADSMWGDIDGKTRRENQFGKGRVLCGYSLEDALAHCGLQPDFSCTPVSGTEIGFYHRRLDNRDIYFVANHSDTAFVGDARFRVEGQRPAVWDPVRGTRKFPAIFSSEPGRTRVRISLPPRASTFVVFEPPSTPEWRIEKLVSVPSAIDPSSPAAGTVDAVFEPEAGGRLTVAGLKPATYEITLTNGQKSSLCVPPPADLNITGPWKVSFPPGSGAPPEASFESLTPWTQHADPGIKYFSGTAQYRGVFEVPDGVLTSHARQILDLGGVGQLAEIRLNGTSLGVVWTPPYAVDATEALKKGKNELVIIVTNVWFNRLLGDALVPAEQRIAGFSDPQLFEKSFLGKVKNQPLVSSGLLGPVRISSLPHAAFASGTTANPSTQKTQP